MNKKLIKHLLKKIQKIQNILRLNTKTPKDK